MQIAFLEQITEYVYNFVCRQPPGYSEGPDYIETQQFDDGLSEVAKTYISLHLAERDLNAFSPSFDYAHTFPVRPAIPIRLCPIHIIADLARFKIPDVSVRFIKCIGEIVETKGFQKLFNRMPQDIQKRWISQKNLLKQRFPSHFEKFQDVFSIRLGDSYRVHLRPLANRDCWEAVEIGPHTSMGHG